MVGTKKTACPMCTRIETSFGLSQCQRLARLKAEVGCSQAKKTVLVSEGKSWYWFGGDGGTSQRLGLARAWLSSCLLARLRGLGNHLEIRFALTKDEERKDGKGEKGTRICHWVTYTRNGHSL